MGQQHSSRIHPILDLNWVTLTPDTHTLFSNVNPYSKRTLRNTTNNQQVEQYLLEFASQIDYKQYSDELKVRMQPADGDATKGDNGDGYYYLSPYIYTVKYFMDSTVRDMCSTVYKGLLYVQKVDLRLKQINDIPLSDQLYLIKATLQGFKLLYQRVGYFDITEEMVFISKDGKVKVWLNSNLSKNEPLFIPLVGNRDSHGSQSDMIVQLLDLIEQNSDTQQQQGIRFKQYLTKKGCYNRLSFYRALQQFQAYCLQQHLVVQSGMRSIYELYHQDEPQQSEIVQQSGHIRAKDGKNTISQLQLPSQMDSNQMISSKVSKCSHDYSRSIVNRAERKQECNRPKSINTSYAHKMNQLSFHQSRLPPVPNCGDQRVRQMPAYHNHFLNTLTISYRQASPAVRVRAPSCSNSRRSQHNSGVQKSKPTVIKFNYMANTQNPPKFILSNQLVDQKQQTSHSMAQNLITIKSIRTDSRASTKQMNAYPTEPIKQKASSKWINYYTSDQTYTLDREIAEDLQKYLGYHVSS